MIDMATAWPKRPYRPVLLLDTNVLVAGLRSSRGASHALLGMVGRDCFTMALTAALVLEYEDVLKRSGLVPVTSGDVDRLLDYYCSVGKCSEVWFRLRPSVADPGDELVLEAAVASGSDWIVTLNPRDMTEGAGRYGIEVLSPRDALHRLEDLNEQGSS